VLGDARLSLWREPDQSFGLIILDAFNSDAIPIHLITREAVQLYLAKLAPHGLLAFHISNRHLDLRPVLSNIAADLGLSARVFIDRTAFRGTTLINADEKDASIWALMARDESDLAPISNDARWTPFATDPAVGVWTDDYSNLLGTLIWRYQ